MKFINKIYTKRFEKWIICYIFKIIIQKQKLEYYIQYA